MISFRTLIAIICLTVLTGCAACFPGQSKLDEGMVEQTASAQSVPGAENVINR